MVGGRIGIRTNSTKHVVGLPSNYAPTDAARPNSTKHGRRRRYGKNTNGTARKGSNHGGAAKAPGIWRWTEKKSPRIMKTKNTDLLTHAGRGLAGRTGPQSTLTIGGQPSMYWRGIGQAIGGIRNVSDRDRNQHGPDKTERNGTNRHGSLKQGSDRCSLGSNRARHFTFHISHSTFNKWTAGDPSFGWHNASFSDPCEG